MIRKTVDTVVSRGLVLAVVLGAVGQARAENVKTTYPSMAPIDRYLIADRTAEVAMARRPAPAEIALNATVLVLGRHGYETAVEGKNGFVCLVERSWISI